MGPLIAGLLGKIIGKATDKFLPDTMTEEEKAKFAVDARGIAMEEYKIAMQDVDSARKLAMKESEDAPPWTKALTVTHRPIWSFVMLGIFVFTLIAPVLGLPSIPLTEIHKEIMQTVIIFYFGGRSIEKTVGLIKKTEND